MRPLQKFIDSLDFARTSGSLDGTLGVAQLSRLADSLVATEGVLQVRLDGSRDEDGRSWLHVKVAGSLMLGCQRCLGGVQFSLDINSRLQLIGPGEAWPDDDLEDDSADAIASERELALLALIEDEVLLALPIAPRHENCESPRATGSKNGEYGSVPKLSPFSALTALKKSRTKE